MVIISEPLLLKVTEETEDMPWGTGYPKEPTKSEDSTKSKRNKKGPKSFKSKCYISSEDESDGTEEHPSCSVTPMEVSCSSTVISFLSKYCLF